MTKMYQNKFVMSLMIGKKPVQDRDGFVELDEGTEFSLRFRNKHPKDAVVSFTIDGEDASGNGYIVSANSFIDVERFANVAKRFKVARLDSDEAILEGKNGYQDGTKGLITATFHFGERVYRTAISMPYVQPLPFTWPLVRGGSLSGGRRLQTNINVPTSTTSTARGCCKGENKDYDMIELNVCNCSTPLEHPGTPCADSVGFDTVTIEGSASNQCFQQVEFDVDYTQSTVINLMVRGAKTAEQSVLTLRRQELDRQIEDAKERLQRLGVERQQLKV